MRVLALLISAVILAACTSDPEPSATPPASLELAEPPSPAPLASPVTGSSAPPASSSPTSAPTSTATATPASTPSGPAQLAWSKLGTIATGAGGQVEGIRRLGAGYVAWGSYAKGDNVDPPFTTWFSADGQTWERTVHATSIVPCPGWTARPDLESVYGPTSDGRTLVFTATYLLPDADACDRAWMISLSTTDGRTWSRSEPFGQPHDNPAWAMWAEGNWPIRVGWETVVSDGSDFATMSRTTDLETWTQVGPIPASSPEKGPSFRVLATDPEGTRLAVIQPDIDQPEPPILQSSTDGVNWAYVRTLPPGFGVVAVVPPSAAGLPWLVAIEREDPEQARILVSTDLVDWSRTTMPKPGLRDMTDAGAGWVTVGLWPARDTGCGNACRPERPSLYTSADGLTWINHPRSMPPRQARLLAGGGDGEVVAGTLPSKGVVTLWRLESGG